MRKLHLVGLTTDQKGLIFTARRGSDSGGYVVALDAEVLNAIAKAQGRPNGAAVGPMVKPGGEYTPGPGSQTRRRGLLTPREMQARLRAGRSVEDVAEEADVEVEWVERFAVPILAEQAQVVELARTLVFVNAKGAASAHPLDESVAWNLLDRGARVTDDVFDGSWTAYQLHDQVWMIRFAYRSRGRAQEARWELDVGTGELVARNKVASELAYVEPGARLRRPPPPEVEEEAVTAPSASATRAARSTTRRAPDSSPVDDDEGDDDDEDDGQLQFGSSVDVDDIDDDSEEADDAVGDSVDVVELVAPEAAVDAPAEASATPAGATDAPTDTDETGASAATATAKAPAAGAKAGTRTKPKSAPADAAALADALATGAPAAAPVPTKAKAKTKARGKAKKSPPTPIPPIEAPAPVRGLLVSTGRATRPAPPRGLLVSSPRMRGLTGGVGTTPSAPKPDASPPARTKAAPEAAAPEATDAPPSPAEPKASRPEPSDAPSPPGGAGVRKAVAQVTSVRVAASRALVARAMLPKPTPTVVSRPTLEGRVVNQPVNERPPVPIRSRQPAPTPEPPPSPARPPLRLQPVTSDGPPPPALRSAPRPDDGPPADDDARDAARSPFVPRPASSGRAERPAGARPPSAAPRPAPRPGPRPEGGRPEQGRTGGRPAPRPAQRPAPRPDGRPEPGRPEARRPEARRPEARRPEETRPEGRRPELRRPEARRPEARRPDEPPTDERRPNDRRLDDRGARPRPAPSPDIEPGYDGDEADDRSGSTPAVGGRPRIAAQPAGDWRPSSGRPRPPSAPPGPPVVAPPTGIDEPRPRRRLRRPPR